MILLTGAAGFFGIHATKILLERGEDVLAVGTSPFPSEVASYFDEEESKHLVFSHCDISRQEAVTELFARSKIDRVIHAAVVTILGKDQQHQERYITSVNALGTLNLLEAARRHGVSRFIYVSSSGVYGSQGRGVYPVHETTPVYPGPAKGVYLACKIYSEMLCETFQEQGDFKVAIARLGSPYGPWERPTRSRKGMSLIHRLMALAMSEKHIRIYGRDVMRDWTHMRDIARGITGLATCDETKLQHTIYNVTSGINVSIEHVLACMKQFMPHFTYEFVDSNNRADLNVLEVMSRGPLDISRLREDIGYKTEFSIESGLENYKEWAQAHRSLFV